MSIQTYEDVINSKDADELIEHCKDAAIDNYNTNDVDWDNWENGYHIADTYLTDNHAWIASDDICSQITAELDEWLEQMKKRPPVGVIRQASEDAWEEDADQIVGKSSEGKWIIAHKEDMGRQAQMVGETWTVSSDGLHADA